MKKIILSLLAIAGIFASCSNDDIEVNTYGDLVYAVSTQSVYEDFQIAEPLKERLLSTDYNIGVYTFIYNETGDLVASDSVFTRTFGRIEQNFKNIPTGLYTAITLEMMVNKNDDNTSESWAIIGKDKMSTLEIVNKTYLAYWYSAVGLSTQTLNITKGGNQVYEIQPKGIGAIIDTYFMNFDRSNYIRAAFHTKDQPRGRYLSPEYFGEDRFDYESYNAERTWDTRGRVYTGEPLPDEVNKTIYLLEEGNIKCCFGAYEKDPNGGFINSFHAYPSTDYKYTIQDGKYYYSMFCYVGGPSNNNCKAIIKNSFDELIDWYKSLEFHFIDSVEPFLVWGSSSSEVDSYMKNSGMNFVEDGYNQDNTLYYSYWVNYSNTLSYEYRFDTSKTNLSSLLMVYSKSKYSKAEVLQELKQKYVYDGYNDNLGGDFLHTEDNSTLLLLLENDEDLRVLYVSGSNTSAAPRNESFVLSRFKDARSLFKSNK